MCLYSEIESFFPSQPDPFPQAFGEMGHPPQSSKETTPRENFQLWERKANAGADRRPVGRLVLDLARRKAPKTGK